MYGIIEKVISFGNYIQEKNYNVSRIFKIISKDDEILIILAKTEKQGEIFIYKIGFLCGKII
jgi:hypothetical protein